MDAAPDTPPASAPPEAAPPAPVPPVSLFFLRHAPAGDPEGWEGPDDERPLTARGRRKLRKQRKGLRSLVGEADAILTSPALRSVETAELAAKYLAFTGELERLDALAHGGSATALDALLARHPPGARLVLVGHSPDLERWIAYATTGQEQPFLELKKGGACRVDVDPARTGARGTLRWLVTPTLLRDL